MLELSQIASFYPEHLRPFKRNILREYLQHKILEAIFDSPSAAKLAFMGGTCINIVHANPRFSEDLDFDNRGLSRDGFEDLSRRVRTALEREGYTLELKTTCSRAFRAHFRFSGILQESGLSGHRGEKLLIHVDTEPQDFDYDPERFILNRFDVFVGINTVPAGILLAQKFYSILNRPRPMGRDFLDAVFLMGKTTANMDYIGSKLDTGDVRVLKDKLLAVCGKLDLAALARDVEPFLFDRKDVRKVLMFPEYVERAL